MVYCEKFVVVVKCNGKILREIDDFITLPFDSEYSIYMKNLESRRCLVNISIDGSDVLNGSSIILMANSEFELKGFLNNNIIKNKFKFIKKTNKIVEFRGDKIDDGIIRVEYAFEKILPLSTTTYYNNYWTCTGGLNPSGAYFSRPVYNNINYTSSSGINEAGSYCSSSKDSNSESLINNNLNLKNDEGITVKGSEMKQILNNGWMGETEQSNIITLKLKGTNSKNIEVMEPITVKNKIKCETCGTTNKSYAKFCVECGTYLR